MFELEQVEEDGERRLAQLNVRNESHLEERTDYSWNGTTEGNGKMEFSMKRDIQICRPNERARGILHEI